MKVWSEVNLSSLGNNLRIEAEYYQPHYLSVENRLKKLNAENLTKYVYKITDGTHYTPTYLGDGVKFFSALNVKENYFDVNNKFKFISEKEHLSLIKRCKPEPGDILMRKVGVGPRWSCVIPKTMTEEFSIFVSVALIKVNQSFISPYYLSTFINCHYGQNQLLRIQKGVSQPDLHLEDIAQLKVPRFKRELENQVENLVLKGLEKKELSKSFYNQAQEILEKEVGLDQFVIEKPKNYVANYSEVVTNSRIDSQCFKPDYIDYEKHLRKRGNFDYLRNVITSSIKGQQMKTTIDGNLEYVSIKDIQGLEVYSEENCIQSSNLKTAQKDDLLLAITGATIGKIGIISRSDRLAFSGDLLSLKTNDKIDPYYLLAVMSNRIGQSQCQRWITGSTNGHLSPIDVNKIVIPRLSAYSEKKIAQLLKSVIAANYEFEQYLEQAKKQVEDLIEGVIIGETI